MFEFSVAYKYLIPRRRQLSVSIITIISTLVISVVVWLILVFFSVTTGLEKGWVEKLVALTAPIRLTPTEEYYQSYYYNVDSISDASDYSTKTIGEKLSAESTDPYDPGIDMEIPPYWRSPDTNASGTTKDLVKDTFSLLQSQGLTAGDYDHALAQMRLRLVRHSNEGMGSTTQTFLTQGCYLSSFDAKNHSVATITLEPTASDLANIFALLATSADAATEDMPSSDDSVSSETFHEKLDAFLENTTITHLKTPPEGWYIPPSMLKTPKLSAFALVDGDTMIKASLDEKSIPSAESPEDLIFNIEIDIKGVTLSGSTPYGELTIGAATTTKAFEDAPETPPPWIYTVEDATVIPSDDVFGEGVIVGKGFRDHGVLLGDRGYLSYHMVTAGSLQEQRVPMYVAGFYDPGIIPLGGKFVLADSSVTSLINATTRVNDNTFGNGINVWFDDVNTAATVKTSITKSLTEKGLAKYWNVETFREYEFTKDILEQLQSEKYLFSLLAIIIMIVACSNIISMLVLLVNDKKKEIGILQSMGASRWSVALIFGFCGIIIGIISSGIGTIAAIATMHNLPAIIDVLSAIQGHELLNSTFYGDTLPTTLSAGTLKFVIIATATTSLLAGVIPAIKASLLNPTKLLRSE